MADATSSSSIWDSLSSAVSSVGKAVSGAATSAQKPPAAVSKPAAPAPGPKPATPVGANIAHAKPGQSVPLKTGSFWNVIFPSSGEPKKDAPKKSVLDTISATPSKTRNAQVNVFHEGKPAVGADVVLKGPSPRNGKTNHAGQVTFSGLKPGKYTASANLGGTYIGTSVMVDLSVQNRPLTIRNVQAKPGTGGLQLVARDTTGKPVPGAELFAFCMAVGESRKGPSSGAGSCAWQGLKPGSYHCSASHAGASANGVVEVKAGQTAQLTLTLAIKAPPPVPPTPVPPTGAEKGTLKVVVLDAQRKAVVGAEVSGACLAVGEVKSGTSNAGGMCQWQVKHGLYHVSASYQGQEAKGSAEVTPTQAGIVTLVLGQGEKKKASIQLRVTWKATGQPASEATGYLQRADWGHCETGASSGAGVTVFSGLDAQSYTVSASYGTHSAERSLVLKEGQSASVHLQLDGAPAEAGKCALTVEAVFAEGGKPALTAKVELVKAGGPLRTLVTGGDGKATCSIDPGSYTCTAWILIGSRGAPTSFQCILGEKEKHVRVTVPTPSIVITATHSWDMGVPLGRYFKIAGGSLSVQWAPDSNDPNFVALINVGTKLSDWTVGAKAGLKSKVGQTSEVAGDIKVTPKGLEVSGGFSIPLRTSGTRQLTFDPEFAPFAVEAIDGPRKAGQFDIPPARFSVAALTLAIAAKGYPLTLHGIKGTVELKAGLTITPDLAAIAQDHGPRLIALLSAEFLIPAGIVLAAAGMLAGSLYTVCRQTVGADQVVDWSKRIASTAQAGFDAGLYNEAAGGTGLDALANKAHQQGAALRSQLWQQNKDQYDPRKHGPFEDQWLTEQIQPRYQKLKGPAHARLAAAAKLVAWKRWDAVEGQRWDTVRSQGRSVASALWGDYRLSPPTPPEVFKVLK